MVIIAFHFVLDGLKNVQKRKRPLICQFAISLDEPKQAKVDAKIDRSFWKKRLDSITNEYKKWRELSRRQNKLKSSTDDGQVNLRYRKSSKLSRDTNHLDSLAKLYSNIQAANAANNNSSSSSSSSAFNSSSGQSNTSNTPGSGSGVNSSNNVNNNAYPGSSYSNATNYGVNSISATFNLDSGFNSVSSPGRGMGGASSMGSSSYAPVSAHSSTNHHNPIAHKQMPYRMRSPSPGLFQDFDLYNFSSDTLFSTYCFDDPKDPSE